MSTTITISDLSATEFLSEHFPEELDRLEQSAVKEYRQAAICQALGNRFGMDWSYGHGADGYTVERPEHLAGTYTLEELEKLLGLYVGPEWMTK